MQEPEGGTQQGLSAWCQRQMNKLMSGCFPSMSIPGIEIHRAFDEYGPIRVFEDGPVRFLAFSEDSQQSALNCAYPSHLVFHYTQAMLLSLLYLPAPKYVTMLGLGAGSLIHALQAYDSQINITAVELRETVRDIAQQFFALPDHPMVTISIEDAYDFITQGAFVSDIIFTDIYSDEGMNERQLSLPFLEAAYARLSAQGILVFNLWDQGKGSHPLAKQRLEEVFDGPVLACPVEDGNLIVYAFKGGIPQTNPRYLQTCVKRLGKKLVFPVSERLQRMKTL